MTVGTVVLLGAGLAGCGSSTSTPAATSSSQAAASSLWTVAQACPKVLAATGSLGSSVDTATSAQLTKAEIDINTIKAQSALAAQAIITPLVDALHGMAANPTGASEYEAFGKAASELMTACDAAGAPLAPASP